MLGVGGDLGAGAAAAAASPAPGCDRRRNDVGRQRRIAARALRLRLGAARGSSGCGESAAPASPAPASPAAEGCPDPAPGWRLAGRPGGSSGGSSGLRGRSGVNCLRRAGILRRLGRIFASASASSRRHQPRIQPRLSAAVFVHGQFIAHKHLSAYSRSASAAVMRTGTSVPGSPAKSRATGAYHGQRPVPLLLHQHLDASRRRDRRRSGHAPARPRRAAGRPAPGAPGPAPAACARPACPAAASTGRHADRSRPQLLDRSRACWRTSPRSRSGKPAIRSAPKTTSGRAARARATTAIASARLCRRFIRFRIRSSIACRLRCRCGISRGSPPSSAQQLVVDRRRIERGEPQPRQLRHFRAGSPRPASPSVGRSGRSAPHEQMSTPVSTISR